MFTFEHGHIYDPSKNVVSNMCVFYDEDDHVLLCIGDETIVKPKYEALFNTVLKTRCGIKPILITIPVTAENGEQLCEDVNHMLECTGYIEQWLKKLDT